MAETTFPGSLNTFRDDWPGAVGGPDGIVNDYTGQAFTITTSGSAPTVTISPGPAGLAWYRLAGFLLKLDAPKTIDLTTVPNAQNPTTGQKRVDRVVARYDWSKPLDEAASIEIHPGAPVSVNGSTAPPELDRVWGTVYESTVGWLSRPAGGVVTTRGRDAPWAVDDELVPDDGFITTPTAPIGRRRHRAGRVWSREMVGGKPEWVDITARVTKNRPRVYAGLYVGGTDTLGNAVIPLDLSANPLSATATAYQMQRAEAYPIIEGVNRQRLAVKMVRRDTGRPLTSNPCQFFWQVTTDEGLG